MRNAMIASHIFNTPLMIHPNKLDAIIYGLRDRFDVVADKPEPGLYTTQSGEIKKPGYRVIDGVGILDIFGVLAHRGGIEADSSYILGYQDIARRFQAAMDDPLVHSILLNIDSPGGAVSGAFDLAEQIYEARGTKRIFAIAGDTAASAAYLIASAANEIAVTRTSNTGSIGVVMRHVDWSKYMSNEGVSVTHIFAGDHKVDGNPYEPLPDNVRDRFQQEIDQMYQLFVDTVARNRGMEAQDIINTQAQIYLGPEAIGTKLADIVSTPDKLISRLAAEQRGAGSRLSLTSEKEKETMAENDLQTTVDGDETETVITQATSDEPATIESDVAQARTNERQRVATIMNSDAAQGRQQAALALATETDMKEEAAITTLSKMPLSAGAPSRLDEAMAKIDQPNIGAEESGNMTAAERIVSDYRTATGQR